MILYDSTRSYHFYDPSAILIVLVRWNRKIVRSYDPNRDFENHGSRCYGGGGLHMMRREIFNVPLQRKVKTSE